MLSLNYDIQFNQFYFLLAEFTQAPGSITLSVAASSTPPPLRLGAMRVGQVTLEDTSSYKSPCWITCIVEDSGRGLSLEEREALFERFSQARPKTDQVSLPTISEGLLS